MSDMRKLLINIAEDFEYWRARAERLERELLKLEEFLQEAYADEFEKYFKPGIHSAVDLAVKLLRREKAP